VQHTIIEILVDAGAWQFWGKMKLLFFASPPVSKNVPAPLAK